MISGSESITDSVIYPEYNPAMSLRILLALALSGGAIFGCSCSEPGVRDKLADSDVVFLGTITGFRISGETRTAATVNTSGRIAVFKVSRFWKGEVGQTSEMPAFEETTFCLGFWPGLLKIGNELLIYARGSAKSSYTTMICGYHLPVADAGRDLLELGAGQVPR